MGFTLSYRPLPPIGLDHLWLIIEHPVQQRERGAHRRGRGLEAQAALQARGKPLIS
jgi:hypothetical protein